MRNLEIGARGRKIDSRWEVLDTVKSPIVDIVADICKPLPIGDNTYDLIYMSHVLEHIAWYDTIKVLKELHRILKKDGVIEIWVPDFEKIVEVYLKQKIQDGWYMRNPNKNPYVWISGRLFWGLRGEYSWHRAMFDSRHLHACLEEVGFCGVSMLENTRTVNHGYINLGVSGKK